jgi:hypothetical protein
VTSTSTERGRHPSSGVEHPARSAQGGGEGLQLPDIDDLRPSERTHTEVDVYAPPAERNVLRLLTAWPGVTAQGPCLHRRGAGPATVGGHQKFAPLTATNGLPMAASSSLEVALRDPVRGAALVPVVSDRGGKRVARERYPLRSSVRARMAKYAERQRPYRTPSRRPGVSTNSRPVDRG